jgi:hypothetical protein
MRKVLRQVMGRLGCRRGGRGEREDVFVEH